MSSLGILSGPRRALGEEKKLYTTAGREYWIDLFDRTGEDVAHPIDQRVYFSDWVKRTNAAFPGSVQVLVSESKSGGWFSGRDWDWVKFRTNQSVPWASSAVGIPTAIKPGETINSSADTSTASDAIDQIDKENEEKISEWSTYAKWGLVVVGLAVGAHFLGSAAKLGQVVKETVE
jgi:hypothetical protein